MDNLLLSSIKDDLIEDGIKRDKAIKCLRSFCRKYGGLKIYFSQSPQSKRAFEIFNLISEALKEEAIIPGEAEKITRIFLRNFYNIAEYIPLEIRAFRKELASEILKEYKESKDKSKTQLEICSKYNISFVTFFNLCKEAKEKAKESDAKLKKQKNFPKE